MASWFSSFFSNGNWIPAALLAGATIYSATTASRANVEAANKATAAAREQANAIREGNRLAQQRFDTVQATTAPAVAYQTEAMNSGTALQPWQQQQVDDTRRVATNALNLSPLRGSGRAMVAAIRKVEEGTTNQFLEQNRQRADRAASGLAGQYFSAGTQAANLDASTGRAAGQAAWNQGLIDADATTADATLRGRAIGDLATIINDAAKEGRRSSYGAGQTGAPSEDEKKKATMAT